MWTRFILYNFQIPSTKYQRSLEFLWDLDIGIWKLNIENMPKPKFSWEKIRRPYVMLAPMAGYTDSAFRQIVKEIAPPVICVTELISADGLAFGSRKTKEMLKFKDSERPQILQLFGKHLEQFKESVKMAEDMGFDGVDINMGCPARKVVNSMHGSALIKTPELAFQIVETCVRNTKLPVSVKTRLGWMDDSTLESFALGLQNAGAKMITIHGRTAKQAFEGVANWEPIYRIKEKLSIPVTGNGDIKSAEDALKMLGNLDGIMVGRALFGNPWLMGEICVALGLCKKKDVLPRPKDFGELKKFILHHLSLSVEMLGPKKGILDMRKTMAIYIKGLPNAAECRSKLVRAETEKEVEKILTEFRCDV